jgi:hypothetical protein
MANLLGAMYQAALSKVNAIRISCQRFTLSADAVDHLSIDYTTIPMKKECNQAVVYYSGETIAAYRKLLNLYDKITNDQYVGMTEVGDLVTTYISGWSSLKIITDQNIAQLDAMIERRRTKLTQYHTLFDQGMSAFNVKNEAIVEMVDHINVPLYHYTTEFPYRKAYAHFYKRQRVNEKLVQTHINNDIDLLDQLADLLGLLYAGWEKSGKGEDYERYRDLQRRLIVTTQNLADVLELDITLYEKFTRLNETVINFKIYPK